MHIASRLLRRLGEDLRCRYHTLAFQFGQSLGTAAFRPPPVKKKRNINFGPILALLVLGAGGWFGWQHFRPESDRTRDLMAGESVTLDVEFRPDGLPSTHTATLDVDFTGGNGAGLSSRQAQALLKKVPLRM